MSRVHGHREIAALVLAACCAACCAARPLDAQAMQSARSRTTEGDSTIVAAVRGELEALFPAYRPATALLTTANPLEQPGAVGTEVQGFEEAGRLSRIVASTWTPYGKYAVEYFGAPGEPPRFVFETAVYRDDAVGRPTGRNFWGQPSWERRYYFDRGRVRFTETVGDGAAPSVGGDAHVRRFEALRALIVRALAARQQH
jgi:hypothetical protein